MRFGGVAILFVASVIAWWYLFPASAMESNSFGPTGQASAAVWAFYRIAGYLTLLLGGFLGTICRLLMERKGQGQETIDIIKVVKSSVTHVDFWIAMIASPVIYLGFLQSGVNMPDAAFFFFALQTGFSSTVIANSLLAGKGMASLPEHHATATDRGAGS